MAPSARTAGMQTIRLGALSQPMLRRVVHSSMLARCSSRRSGSALHGGFPALQMRWVAGQPAAPGFAVGAALPSHRRSSGMLTSRQLTVRNATADAAATTTSTLTEKEEGTGQYPFAAIESKWQAYWEANDTFRTDPKVDMNKPKYYALDMFPYPSGAGLHVGHPEGYTATDITARFKRMKGYNVMHPMGWDSFGLPAEQYAIETGTHPRVTTAKNIDRFRAQLKSLGFSYDWKREVATTDPKYYKWTQWIFQQLIKNDLAYQADVAVNWCPALGTVLANEEVIDGLSERGGHPVVRKPMRQWMLRITKYADRLLDDLDELDWPESIKDMQRNWIGRSEGAEIRFEVAGGVCQPLSVFTTRADTLFGVTYMSVAPEHPDLAALTTPDQKAAVEAYVEASARKSDLERTELQKDKTGVWTGSMAINPLTGEEFQVWVADYVLGSYGSGAVMAVPAHDERDHEFAVKYGLPIKQVVAPAKQGKKEVEVDVQQEAYTGPGSMINSGKYDGQKTAKAKKAIVYDLAQAGQGEIKVNYKLRDWLFARQRYWGEPFPIMFEEGSDVPVLVPEDELPLVLPDTDSFKPTGDGSPPLAAITDWVNVTSPNGKPAMRETNTMPQWAGSCWYYLRFVDPENDQYCIDPELEKYWMPVDLYVGGAEHSVLHLLYARFWHKVLYDCGVVTTKEPFQRLVNQGMILGEVEFTAYQDAEGAFVSAVEDTTGLQAVKLGAEEVEKKGEGYVLKADGSLRVDARAHKMSKSRGNVVNPDDIVTKYGADSLRLYEMFMGPLRETKVWSTRGVEGVHRFLGRSWRLMQASLADQKLLDAPATKEQLKILHTCIQKVTVETEAMRFNTAISAMMEFVNAATKWGSAPRELLEPFVILLAPYAPHVAEEFWALLGHTESLTYEPWPEVKEEYLVEDSVRIAVQVNGKVRGEIMLALDADEAAAMEAAAELENVVKFMDGKQTKKIIYRMGKILNIVVA